MKNGKFIYPLLIFVICLAVYIVTLNPTVTFTDNGELAGVAFSLGVAHPSGYPLLSMLGHLWTLIPMGWTVVYKLNMLSAIFAAASSVVFYFTVRLFLNNLKYVKKVQSELKKGKKSKADSTYMISASPFEGTTFIDLTAISFAFLFAFSALVWEQAVVYEVYSLQFLLINLTLYFFLKAITMNEEQNKFYILSALFMGLSFSNHLTTILIVPAILFMFFRGFGTKFDFSKKKFKYITILACFVLAGVSLYIYMPLRSMAEPDFNWGVVHRGFDKFLYHIQGKQYQVWMFSGMEAAWANFGKFLVKIPYNLGYVGIIVFIAGIYRLVKSYRSILWFYIILFITCIIYSVNYSIHDIDVYFYLAIYAMLLITSAGFIMLAEKYNRLKYAVFLLPVLNIAINYADNDKSDNYLVYDYTRNVVDNVGKDAIIISAQWDYWVSAFWYLQKVENYRPDIMVIDKELLRRTWYPHQLEKWYPEPVKNCQSPLNLFMDDLNKFESGLEAPAYPNIQPNFENLLRCFIESNIDKRPIYVTFDYMNSGADASPLKGYNIIPYGFAFKVEKSPYPVKINLENLKLDRMLGYKYDKNNHLETGILEVASLNITNFGRYALATGDKASGEKAFELALRVWADNNLASQHLSQIRR